MSKTQRPPPCGDFTPAELEAAATMHEQEASRHLARAADLRLAALRHQAQLGGASSEAATFLHLVEAGKLALTPGGWPVLGPKQS